MLLHVCTQLHHIRFQTRHFSRQHSHLPLDSIKSRSQSAIDRCHYRIRLIRKLQSSVIVLHGACTTARAEDVADLSACSRRYSVQCFSIRRASCTLNSWSSAPGIFLQPRVLCRFFLRRCSRRVWVQISQGRHFWLLQRKRGGHTPPRRSASTTTVPTSILRHRSQIHYSSLGKLPRCRSSTTPLQRINRVFCGRGAIRTRHLLPRQKPEFSFILQSLPPGPLAHF